MSDFTILPEYKIDQDICSVCSTGSSNFFKLIFNAKLSEDEKTTLICDSCRRDFYDHDCFISKSYKAEPKCVNKASGRCQKVYTPSTKWYCLGDDYLCNTCFHFNVRPDNDNVAPNNDKKICSNLNCQLDSDYYEVNNIPVHFHRKNYKFNDEAAKLLRKDNDLIFCHMCNRYFDFHLSLGEKNEKLIRPKFVCDLNLVEKCSNCERKIYIKIKKQREKILCHLCVCNIRDHKVMIEHGLISNEFITSNGQCENCSKKTLLIKVNEENNLIYYCVKCIENHDDLKSLFSIDKIRNLILNLNLQDNFDFFLGELSEIFKKELKKSFFVYFIICNNFEINSLEDFKKYLIYLGKTNDLRARLKYDHFNFNLEEVLSVKRTTIASCFEHNNCAGEVKVFKVYFVVLNYFNSRIFMIFKQNKFFISVYSNISTCW